MTPVDEARAKRKSAAFQLLDLFDLDFPVASHLHPTPPPPQLKLAFLSSSRRPNNNNISTVRAASPVRSSESIYFCPSRNHGGTRFLWHRAINNDSISDPTN